MKGTWTSGAFMEPPHQLELFPEFKNIHVILTQLRKHGDESHSHLTLIGQNLVTWESSVCKGGWEIWLLAGHIITLTTSGFCS